MPSRLKKMCLSVRVMRDVEIPEWLNLNPMDEGDKWWVKYNTIYYETDDGVDEDGDRKVKVNEYVFNDTPEMWFSDYKRPRYEEDDSEAVEYEEEESEDETEEEESESEEEEEAPTFGLMTFSFPQIGKSIENKPEEKKQDEIIKSIEEMKTEAKERIFDEMAKKIKDFDEWVEYQVQLRIEVEADIARGK